MPDAVISWDTCILIDAIQKTAWRWDHIAPMLNLAQQGDLKIVLSTICVAETIFLRGFSDQGMSQADQNSAIERWLEHKFLVKRAADYGTCEVAAELCRQAYSLFSTKLSTTDAIVIATAIRHGAATLVTYDDKQGESMLALDQKFALPNGKRLRICTPEAWTTDNSPQLFL